MPIGDKTVVKKVEPMLWYFEYSLKAASEYELVSGLPFFSDEGWDLNRVLIMFSCMLITDIRNTKNLEQVYSSVGSLDLYLRNAPKSVWDAVLKRINMKALALDIAKTWEDVLGIKRDSNGGIKATSYIYTAMIDRGIPIQLQYEHMSVLFSVFKIHQTRDSKTPSGADRYTIMQRIKEHNERIINGG